MNDRLCALLHGSREIRENMLAIQKLIALEDNAQEKPFVLETIT